MKINKAILISFFCCFLMLMGCNKATYNKISEENETAWSIYDLNETFRFISTQGDLRTYNVGGKFKAYNRSGNTYDEYLYTTIYLDGDTTDYNYAETGYRGLFLDQSPEGFSVKVGLPHFYENVAINIPSPVSQTINGKNFSDIYIVAADPFYLDSINYIDTIFYSQSYGFVKYVDKYGETYVRTQ